MRQSNLNRKESDNHCSNDFTSMEQSRDETATSAPARYSLLPHKEAQPSINCATITVEELKRALFKAALDRDLFTRMIKKVFGSYHAQVIERFLTETRSSHWSELLPRITFMETDAPNVAGIYAVDIQSVLISSSCPKEMLEHVIIELIGHHLKTRLDEMAGFVSNDSDYVGIKFRRSFCRNSFGSLCVEEPDNVLMYHNLEIDNPITGDIQLNTSTGIPFDSSVKHCYIDL